MEGFKKEFDDLLERAESVLREADFKRFLEYAGDEANLWLDSFYYEQDDSFLDD